MTHHAQLVSAVFVTFSGNCRQALTFYQTCFGGTLQFETFEKELAGYTVMPVINGSLVADQVMIHGSDLVHNEGRQLGNYMAIFLHCQNKEERKDLIKKLTADQQSLLAKHDDDQKLIEITDAFEVRWVLGV